MFIDPHCPTRSRRASTGHLARPSPIEVTHRGRSGRALGARGQRCARRAGPIPTHPARTSGPTDRSSRVHCSGRARRWTKGGSGKTPFAITGVARLLAIPYVRDAGWSEIATRPALTCDATHRGVGWWWSWTARERRQQRDLIVNDVQRARVRAVPITLLLGEGEQVHVEVAPVSWTHRLVRSRCVWARRRLLPTLES